jgi:hypothetical protein
MLMPPNYEIAQRRLELDDSIVDWICRAPFTATGKHYDSITPDVAAHTLHAVDPFQSGSVGYASKAIGAIQGGTNQPPLD